MAAIMPSKSVPLLKSQPLISVELEGTAEDCCNTAYSHHNTEGRGVACYEESVIVRQAGIQSMHKDLKPCLCNRPACT